MDPQASKQFPQSQSCSFPSTNLLTIPTPNSSSSTSNLGGVKTDIPSPSNSPSNSPRSRKLSEKARSFFSSKKDHHSNNSPKRRVSCDVKAISPPLNYLATADSINSTHQQEESHGLKHKIEQVKDELEKNGLSYEPRVKNLAGADFTSPSVSNGLGLMTDDVVENAAAAIDIGDTGLGPGERAAQPEQASGSRSGSIKVSTKPDAAVESRLKALLSSESDVLSRLETRDNQAGLAEVEEVSTPTAHIRPSIDDAALVSTPKARDFPLKQDPRYTPGSQITAGSRGRPHHHIHPHLPSLTSTQSKLRNLVHSRISSTSGRSNHSTSNDLNVTSKPMEPITIISTEKGELLPLYGALPVVPSTSPTSANTARNLSQLGSASSSQEKIASVGKGRSSALGLDERDELALEKTNDEDGNEDCDQSTTTKDQDLVHEEGEKDAEYVRESQLLGFAGPRNSPKSKQGGIFGFTPATSHRERDVDRNRNETGFRNGDQNQAQNQDVNADSNKVSNGGIDIDCSSANFKASDVKIPPADVEEGEGDVPEPLTQQRPSIKVRIVTWNHGNTVPKGDLEVLLGNVGEYIPPVKDWDVGYDSDDSDFEDQDKTELLEGQDHHDLGTVSNREIDGQGSEKEPESSTNKKAGSKSTLKGSAVIGQEKISRSERIPPLPHNDAHPYHIIVIAGQECPWGDGKRIATGMGMAGEIGDIALNRTRSNAVKVKEKEKEKEKEKTAMPGLKRGISSGNLKNGVSTPASPMITSSQATPWVNEFPFGSPSQQTMSQTATPIPGQNQVSQVANSEVSGDSESVNVQPSVAPVTAGGWGLNVNVSGKGWSDMCEDWLCNGSYASSSHHKGNQQHLNRQNKHLGTSRNSSVVTTSSAGGKESESSSLPDHHQQLLPPSHPMPKPNPNVSSGNASNAPSRAQIPMPADDNGKERNKIDPPKLKLRLEGLQNGKKKDKISTPSIEQPPSDISSVPATPGTSLYFSLPRSDSCSNDQRLSSSSLGSQSIAQQPQDLLKVPAAPIISDDLTRSSSRTSQFEERSSSPLPSLPPLSPGAISPMTENPLENPKLLPHAHHHHLNLKPIKSGDQERIPNEWGRIRSPNPSPSLLPSQPNVESHSSNPKPNADGEHDATPHTLGPYELVTKERMLGCYTAIYVWRGCKDRIRGVSKNHVKSGLLSGRVGNKGGVGISLMLGRSRLLFVNAHLAAHEGKVATRLANVVKIKSELDVDTFLPADDPRNNYEDITEKFDHCFWCGDLNFRVDISRKHADWLLMQKAYQQALEFDQLRAVLKDGIVFKGFEEAPINFPPTYKYDVLKTLKIKRTRTVTQRIIHRRNGSSSKASSAFTNPNLAQSEETNSEPQALSLFVEPKLNEGQARTKRVRKHSGKSFHQNDAANSMTDEDSDSSAAWNPFLGTAFGEHRAGDSDSDEESGSASTGAKRDSRSSAGSGLRSDVDVAGHQNRDLGDAEIADSILSSNTAAAQGPKIFSQGAAIKAKFKFLDLVRSVSNKDSDSASNQSSSPVKQERLSYVARKNLGKDSSSSSDLRDPEPQSSGSPIAIPNAKEMQTFACLGESDRVELQASQSDNSMMKGQNARSSISADREPAVGSSVHNQRTSLPPPPKTYSGPGVKKRSTLRRPSSSDGLSLISQRQSPAPSRMERNNSKASAASAATGRSGAISFKDGCSPVEEAQAYDTSAKQRVPSWCDRVLWRSNVPIEEDEYANPPDGIQEEGFGSKVSRGLSNALMLPQIRQATQKREAARQAAVTFDLPERKEETADRKEKGDSHPAKEKGLEEFGASKVSLSAPLKSKSSMESTSRLSLSSLASSPTHVPHSSPLRRFFKKRGDNKPKDQKKRLSSKTLSGSDWNSTGLSRISRRGAVSAVDLPSQGRLNEKREIRELCSNLMIPPRRESLQFPTTQKEREKMIEAIDESPLAVASSIPRSQNLHEERDKTSVINSKRKSIFRSFSSSETPWIPSPETSTLDLKLKQSPKMIAKDSTAAEAQASPLEISPLTSPTVFPDQIPGNNQDSKSLSVNHSVNGNGTARRASSWWSDRVVMRLPSILTPAKAAAAFASLGLFGDSKDQSERAVEPVLLGPKRGVIECLLYKTLDDREMRALEGRSDHRPVIFVACVGI